MSIVNDNNPVPYSSQHENVFDIFNTSTYDFGMSKLRENLQHEMGNRQWNAYDLSKASGVPQPTIQRFLSGTHGDPRGATVIKLANGLGITEARLRGIGDYIDSTAIREELPRPVIVSNATYLGTFEEWDNDTPMRDDEVALPFFREVELAAGNGRHHVQENHGCKLRFSKATLKRSGVSAADAYCVTVSGNSMEPMMPDGSTIGVDTSHTRIKSGDIYAIDHNGFLRVKQLYQMPDGRVRLRSLNIDEWPDEYVGGDDMGTFRILGRVFWGSWLR